MLIHSSLNQLFYLDAGIGLKLRNGTVRDTKIPDEILKSSKKWVNENDFQILRTAKINSIKVINKHSSAIGYRHVLYICALYRFRKRKQAGNTCMMNVQIANTCPAVQDAPLMSNLYFRQLKVDTPLGTWLQSIGSTNLKKSQNFSKTKHSTSDGLQECWMVSSSRNSCQNIAAT